MKKAILHVLTFALILGICGCGNHTAPLASSDNEGSKNVSSNTSSEIVSEESVRKLGIIFCEVEADESEGNMLDSVCTQAGISPDAYSEIATSYCNSPMDAAACTFNLLDSACTEILYVIGYEEYSDVANDMIKEFPNIVFYTAFIASPIKPIISAKYPIKYNNYDDIYREFSEGRAWVRLSSEVNDFAVIDKSGFIIYSCKDSGIDWEHIATTKFEDGKSVLFNGENNSKHDSGMIIIDVDGNVIFNSGDLPEGVEYYYYGYGNGIFLFLANEADFSSNKWYVCEMNHQGEVTSKIEIDPKYSRYMSNMAYYGEGVFAGSSIGTTILNAIVYNMNTHVLFSTNALNEDLWTLSSFSPLKRPFDNGVSLAASNKIITPKDLMNENACNEWSSNTEKSPFKDFAEGLGYAHYKYYNRTGEVAISLPEDWNIIDAGAFSGGYAAVNLKGADNNIYITVISKDGTIMYNPLKVEWYNSPSWNGYVEVGVDGATAIIDPNGNISTETEIAAVSDEYRIGDIVVHDGFSREENIYTSLNGEVIDTAYCVENYESLIASGYKGRGYNEESDEKNTVVSPSKTYTDIKNFTIEGKWKSIGNYGFGQAQPGAIVAFDGVNCNFFSPSDTYTFSKNGGDYKLECTSLMSTDTLSFTVKTVDENNIDIYHGDSVTELTRVP